jgi:hypothetical protein
MLLPILLIALGAFIPLSDLIFGAAKTAMVSTKMIRSLSRRGLHGSRTVHSAA